MKLDKLLRISEVSYLTGLSIPSIYRLRALGEFPQSIRVGLKAIAWSESEIQDFIENRRQDSKEAVNDKPLS